MKGDVGMSSHEKERQQEDAYRKSFKNATRAHAYTPNPYIFFCSKLLLFFFICRETVQKAQYPIAYIKWVKEVGMGL